MTGMLQFAHDLGLLLDGTQAVRITGAGYMPLSVEQIGRDADGNSLVTIMHWGIQNGDLMRDPEMVFAIHETQSGNMAEPIEFRHDYLGVHQAVYDFDTDGRRTHVRAQVKKELLGFSRLWFKILRGQGFFGSYGIYGSALFHLDP